MLERLYRERWSPLDGIGAIIISPLRELALQIFEVLLQVGCNHNLSAGLLIGGKDFGNEQRRVSNMCIAFSLSLSVSLFLSCLWDDAGILVCTPGRLLQHMNETAGERSMGVQTSARPIDSAGFDCSNVKVLVLDEADRCLQVRVFVVVIVVVVAPSVALWRRPALPTSSTPSSRICPRCAKRCSSAPRRPNGSAIWFAARQTSIESSHRWRDAAGAVVAARAAIRRCAQQRQREVSLLRLTIDRSVGVDRRS